MEAEPGTGCAKALEGFQVVKMPPDVEGVPGVRPEGKLKPQTKGNIFLKQFSLPAFLGIHIAWGAETPRPERPAKSHHL